MEFPPWFRQVMQGRLDEVSARIEHHPDLNDVRAAADRAFEALFEGRDIIHTPEFATWEDKHYLKQGIVNERLYLQGMKDGVQLAMALLCHSMSDHQSPTENES
ncbi:hypothetical protein DUZ99_18360 [Xylanibacillus composti]|uniref:Uncharacterized protein n=1 Tax=Xylanibacillus composti TaxID=1572762 RepID=A0A8J4M2U9_9BACL|nr:hypothetical protein [Xylanibacillus composti]MDT9726933.1 hypothetical protein [Xylanibacillus composti]GIQ70099.1 hypothetical protein XYCOK13_29230 [Xylanibacillus composti]